MSPNRNTQITATIAFLIVFGIILEMVLLSPGQYAHPVPRPSVADPSMWPQAIAEICYYHDKGYTATQIIDALYTPPESRDQIEQIVNYSLTQCYRRP